MPLIYTCGQQEQVEKAGDEPKTGGRRCAWRLSFLTAIPPRSVNPVVKLGGWGRYWERIRGDSNGLSQPLDEPYVKRGSRSGVIGANRVGAFIRHEEFSAQQRDPFGEV